MSTRNRVGYCPICKQNVLLVREALNWPLMIILLIFTGGIGLIIYLIIYYNKPESRCIHCHTQISLKSYKSVQSSTYVQAENQKPQISDVNSDIKVNANEISKLKYCSYCGETLLNELAKFCAHCGSKV
jgi:hypothetical protein